MKRLLQNTANSLGYRISKVRQPIDFPFIDLLDLIVCKEMQQNPDFFFIQIGANDGISADPITELITKYKLRGVLVEPQPQIFQRLVENYAGQDQLIFENSVIAATDGTATLYAIDETVSGLPFWCYQIASLDRDQIYTMLTDEKEKLGLPKDAEKLIVELPLPAITVNSLLQKHNVQKVDLLVIDTIGYDFEILKLFPFEDFQPAIINFEHTLLSYDEQAACFNFLADRGYSFAQVAVDTIAYRNGGRRMGRYFFS